MDPLGTAFRGLRGSARRAEIPAVGCLGIPGGETTLPSGSGGCWESREEAPDSERSDLRAKKIVFKACFCRENVDWGIDTTSRALRISSGQEKDRVRCMGLRKGRRHRRTRLGRELIEVSLRREAQDKCSSPTMSYLKGDRMPIDK